MPTHSSQSPAPTPPAPPPTARHVRAFTLVELIVVILVIAVLAAIAVVAYTTLTNRAQESAANANLRQIASAVLSHHTLSQAPQLTRDEFLASLDEMSVEVVDGLGAADVWTLYGKDHAPSIDDAYAVAFDAGTGTPVTDTAGTRAVVVTHAGDSTYARFILYGAPDTEGLNGATGEVPAGTTPGDVLVNPDLIAHPGSPSPTPNPTTEPTTGPGGGTEAPGTPEPFGSMDVTLSADNFSPADALEWGLTTNEIASSTVWAPEGTAPTQAGLTFSCTANPAVPGGGVKDYWEIATEPDGRIRFGVDWYGTSPDVADVGRAYECTYTAHAPDGTALATRTVTDVVDGNPTSTPKTPEVNTSGYDQTKIMAADGQYADTFGGPVAISGDTMVVGAPNDDDNGENTGSAYIYTRSGGTWTQQQKLVGPVTPSNAGVHGTFGTLVAIDGNTVLINDAVQSAVYVYVRSGSTWSEQALLDVRDITMFLPTDVAISGDTAVIGSSFAGATMAAPGKVVVFQRTGTSWTEQARLGAVNPSPYGQFGHAVDIDGDTIVVGAPSYTSLPDKDSVTVFTRNAGTWTVQATLTPNEPFFGTDVALDGNTFVALASDQNYEGVPNGLLVYTRSGGTWTLQDRVVPQMGAKTPSPRYVDLSGGTAIVGFYYDYWSNQPPRVAVYNRSGATWSRTTELRPIPFVDQDNFSENGISIDGSTIAVGAPSDSEKAEYAGAVYVFTPQR